MPLRSQSRLQEAGSAGCFSQKTPDPKVAAPAPAAQPRGIRKFARKIIIAVIGSTMILAGIAMLVLPGQGILTILAGLALLATEYAWARRWLNKIKQSAEKGAERLQLRERCQQNRFCVWAMRWLRVIRAAADKTVEKLKLRDLFRRNTG